MYATEFIATYDWIQDDWNLGVALTYRELSSTIEDVAIDAAILNTVKQTGMLLQMTMELVVLKPVRVPSLCSYKSVMI